MINQKLGIEVLEDAQYERQFREIRELLDVLENGTTLKRKNEPDVEVPPFRDVIRLAAAARRDGFPTSSSFEGGSASSRYDEDGFAVAPVGDPTGELATSEHLIDPIKDHLKTVVSGLNTMLGGGRSAKWALIQSSQYAEVGPGEPRCRSCERIGEWSNIYRGELCRWCYDFTARWKGRAVPIDLLRARLKEGKRITTSMEKEAFMPSKAKAFHA